MSFRLLIAAPAALLLLSACETVNPLTQSVDPGMGEAVKWNAAVQTINPDPVYDPDGAQPGDSGEKGAAAVERYRTDSVKDVQVQTTTSQQGGSGGGTGPR